jgi:hypothetical protein
VLAGGFYTLDGPPGDRLGAIELGQRRQLGLKSRDCLSRQRVMQRARGTIDGVAFRHR